MIAVAVLCAAGRLYTYQYSRLVCQSDAAYVAASSYASTMENVSANTQVSDSGHMSANGHV